MLKKTLDDFDDLKRSVLSILFSKCKKWVRMHDRMSNMLSITFLTHICSIKWFLPQVIKTDYATDVKDDWN